MKLPHFYSFARHSQVPFEDLAFIAASDEPNLLQEIQIAEQKFETAIESLQIRNERFEQFNRSSDVQEFDFESGKSRLRADPRDTFFLKKATDILYASVIDALPKLAGEMQAVEGFTKLEFKGMKALTHIQKQKTDQPLATDNPDDAHGH